MAPDQVAKDPVKVRAGTIGSRVRWGSIEPRVLRIADLTDEQRRQVRELAESFRRGRSA